jgi:hypothetical protein
MKRHSISAREWEMISAYLDGQLKAKQRQQFEIQLYQRPELHAALEEIQRTRLILRNAATLKAPRNFTLTPEMASSNSTFGFNNITRRLAPVLSFSAALTSILFVIVVLASIFITRPASQPELAMQKVVVEQPTSQPPSSAVAKRMATTEEPATELSMPYPEVLPESEMPEFFEPAPPYAEGNGGGMGGSIPLPTEASLAASAPPVDLTNTFTASAYIAPDVSEQKLQTQGSLEATSVYPPPSPDLFITATPPVYPPPELISNEEPRSRLNIWYIAEIGLGILALGTGIGAYLLRRSVK